LRVPVDGLRLYLLTTRPTNQRRKAKSADPLLAGLLPTTPNALFFEEKLTIPELCYIPTQSLGGSMVQ